MPRIKAEFDNEQGQRLAGLLETPAGEAQAFALFAHCFTCSKDIAAASRITRALAQYGIATLRFDFTGLGNSDGDFANTNFSSNLNDLISAAQFLYDDYDPPTLLIGHSLGGAAVLAAAHEIDSVKAVATIGAPASAKHVEHLFAGARAEIESGSAAVDLGGRKFKIKKQFLEDIERYSSTDHIARLNAALLVLHSPVDTTVSISEASRIYQAARHPKSFISLDQADHLLSRPEDSQYAASVIATWAGRFLSLDQIKPETSSGPAPSVAAGSVLVTERDKKFLRGIYTEKHQFIGDEPTSVGGSDLGPNPYEYLLAALGSCTSMTIRMYANRKKIVLEDVSVTLVHDRIHAQDCEECESESGQVDVIRRQIDLKGELSDAERQRLFEIADRCPVHRTLENEIRIESELI
ncbi:MAG: bifunctional alpha/beta hydrolase/OsmC family protein [Gammaproteobacteria bacterium]